MRLPMLSRVILFVGLAATSAAAADPPGYVVWPKGLPPENSPHKIQFEHHSWSLAHREKSGVVESHLTRTVVMIVQSGEATLVVGADVVDPRTHLRRGTSIRNGIERKVSAGDVINMPAGLPHQCILEPGKQITYIDVVVNAAEGSK
jgi:mannose-6-phosphate isomerase-like protein (cupin superfamily)